VLAALRCMRYQTCMCDHYLGNAIHDINHALSCIIPSSRCATFYNERLLQGADMYRIAASTRFLLHVFDGRCFTLAGDDA
jgi:hypothetical protein